MKTATLSVALSLLLASSALALLRPRYPVKPTPPYRGYSILIEEDSIQTSQKEEAPEPLDTLLPPTQP